MTQEIIEMARDSGMELYGLGKDRARFVHHLEAFAKLVAEKALAEHAIREVQRLGQEIEQVPYGYVSTHTNGQMHFNKTFNGVYRDTATEVVAVYTESTQRTEQEPVADYIAARDMLDAKPVPPRTWVGLTDEDMYVVSEEESCSFIAGAKWSEAILKEKNT